VPAARERAAVMSKTREVRAGSRTVAGGGPTTGRYRQREIRWWPRSSRQFVAPGVSWV